jgi:hypothetical protein
LTEFGGVQALQELLRCEVRRHTHVASSFVLAVPGNQDLDIDMFRAQVERAIEVRIVSDWLGDEECMASSAESALLDSKRVTRCRVG